MTTNNKIKLKYKYDYKKALQEKNKILEILDYPYLKYFVSEGHIRRNFKRLIKIKPHVINHPYNIDYIKLQHHELKFEGMFVLIISRFGEFQKVDEISDYFNEECRNKCLFYNSKGTTYDYYRKNLHLILRHLHENLMEITIKNLREMIFGNGKKDGYGECSTFKPKFLRYIIDHFNSKNILDMSMGWGDRLIAAMASNIDCYHGFDPNPCLHPNYKRMIEFFKPQLVNKNAVFETYQMPFEKSTLKDNFYDLMFTSPPYFDIEIYDSNAETQSTHKKDEKYWYDNYLKVWINLIHKSLKVGGIMSFNINQFEHHNYLNWLFNDMRNDVRWQFIGTIGYTGKVIKNVQPIFFWKKI
jgi:hypothetical protein